MEREYSPIPERALRALEGFPTAYRSRWTRSANARDVRVRYIDAGHFWPLENPQETTQALSDFLNT